MASHLNLLHKYTYLNYLFLGLAGAISTFSFSPFNIKPLIVLSYAILIYSVLSSQSIFTAFKQSIAWGLGYWISGAGWLIVSIHYYGNTNIIVSIIIILFMSLLLSLLFVAPTTLLRLFNIKMNFYVKAFIFSCLLTLIELTRFKLLGGFPWLLPGLVLMDTIGQNVIPILGVYGGSLLIYFIASFFYLTYEQKEFKLFSVGIIFCLIFFPHLGYKDNKFSEGIEVAIIQPSLDPFEKYEANYKNTIEDSLLNLSRNASNSDLIIWPESPLPYLESSNDMKNFHVLTEGLPPILSGAWAYKDDKLFNAMGFLGKDRLYMKRHLVIFGEYVPFEPFLRGLIDFFNMPMSSVNPGNSNQPLFKFNESNILGLICFDIAFPLSFIKEIKGTGFIVNISNDTWFGDSYGPYQHLQIVRARALEANKWVARGTSDGISAIIDNKGTIVEILPKGISGIIKGKIFSIENHSFFYEIGYLIIPLLSFIVLILTYILRFII